MTNWGTRTRPMPPEDRGRQMSIEQARTVLNVEPDVPAGELARAWRRSVKQAHPDQGGSAEKFGEVTAAYELLRNAARTASTAAPLAGGRPAVTVVWWLAATTTVTLSSVLVILLLTAEASITAGPVAVYTLGWSGYSWWHATGRPGTGLRRIRRRITRKVIPGQRKPAEHHSRKDAHK